MHFTISRGGEESRTGTHMNGYAINCRDKKDTYGGIYLNLKYMEMLIGKGRVSSRVSSEYINILIIQY